MKLMKREKVSIFLGAMGAEVLMEAGKLLQASPIIREMQPIRYCSFYGMGGFINQTCDVGRMAVLNSHLQAVDIGWTVAEVALLAGLVLFWWKCVRK